MVIRVLARISARVCVFLGSLLKCPISLFVFFQDGVDEGERHRPVAPQQTRIDRRAVDTFEHRFSTHRVGNRQHTAVFLQSVASGEAETLAGDAAPPAQDRGRGATRCLCCTHTNAAHFRAWHALLGWRVVD